MTDWSFITYSTVKLGFVHPDSVVESRWVGISREREGGVRWYARQFSVY